MKKTFIVLLIAFLSCCSCVRSEKQEVLTLMEVSCENQAFVDLMESIDQYNSDLNVDTKAGGKFWRRLGRIALSDCVGFATGTLLGPGGSVAVGVFASIFAIFRECFDSYPEMNSHSETLDLSESKLYSDEIADMEDCDHVGEIHNAIIDEIYQDNPTLFWTYSEKQLLGVIKQKVAKYYPEESVDYNAVSVEDTKGLVNIILNPEKGMDEVFDELNEKLPTRVAELNVLKSYCKSINAIETNDGVVEYTEGFRAIVVDSDISDDSKEFIQSAVAVAGSSQILWSDCVEETDI